MNQRISLQWDYTTGKTGILQDLFFLLFLAPQVSKGVDDDTKDQVEDDNDHHEEEDHVVDHSSSKHGFLKATGLNPRTINSLLTIAMNHFQFKIK